MPAKRLGAQWDFSFSGLQLRSASGAEVKHFGTTSVRKQLANQAYDISFEVAAVSSPIASFSCIEDAGWTIEGTRAGRKLRRGHEEIEVMRRDGVCWSRMDDAMNADTALRLWPFSADVDDEPARQVRSKNMSDSPDDSARSAHRMTHFFPRSWCDHCVKGFAMEEHHRRRNRSKTTCPEVQLDCMFLETTAGQHSKEASSMFTILDAVEIETLMRIEVVWQKCVIEHVVATVVSFLDAWKSEVLAEE